MAYTISNTDGTTLLVLADGTMDQAATSLTLIGKNYSGFGAAINNNFIKLLANSASSSGNPPRSPLTGQLWYDTTNKRVLVYDGSFKTISGATVSTDKPTLGIGDFWFDSNKGQLNMRTGISTATTVIGPMFPKAVGENGWVLPTVSVKDKNNNALNVTLLKNYGSTVGYIANTATVLSTSTYLSTGSTTATVQGLTILGDIQLSGKFYLGDTTVPQYYGAEGKKGQMAVGKPAGGSTWYMYVCTGTNAWARVALDTGPW